MEEKKEEINILLEKYKILKSIAKFLKVEEDKILNTLRRFKKELEED